MSGKNENNESNSSENILKISRDRFLRSVEAESDIRIDALDDLNFRAGNQWPSEILAQRKLENRPSLTINKMPQFIRQITNDQRQNRPAIKVHPVDDKADIETAKILQGIIRHIEYNSKSDVAIDHAFEGAATNGFGYYRLITDFVDPLSFNQQILFKKIDNPFSVYRDVESIEPDGSDMNYCHIITNMSFDDFKLMNPNAKSSSMGFWESIGDSNGWFNKDTVRIAEYYYKDYKHITICQLVDGSVVEESELPANLPKNAILKKRKSIKCTVKWVKHNGFEILDETELPGKYIPVFPVYGDRLNVDGKIIFESVIRHAKDSARMYNYFATNETEAIALAPKAPFVAAEGQIEGYETQWEMANKANISVLPYKPVSLGGQLVPPPQRNNSEPAVAAITNARLNANEDIKGTTGIYDATLGARSNETSGKAILSRRAQSQMSNFNFIDNLTRTIRHSGRVLVDWIPSIYDTAQAIRILSEDGEQEIVKINEMFERNGKPVQYNLGIGTYDVVVETGPSYATKRLEARDFMLEYAKIVPSQAPILSDLILKNMDVPGASDMAERIKKTLPPGIIDDKKGQEVPPQIQNQMAQMNQMIEGLTQKLNEASDREKTKMIEIESKERIEMMKLQNNLVIEQLKLKGDAANLVFAKELDVINQRLQLLDVDQEFDQDEQNTNFNESVPSEDAIQNNQLTGELTPGSTTGV